MAIDQTEDRPPPGSEASQPVTRDSDRSVDSISASGHTHRINRLGT